MILNIYKSCFTRIYIFSPSIDVDMTWEPVKKYIEHEMKIAHTEKEPLFFDNYDAGALQNIITTQHKVIDFMKKQKNTTKLYSVLIVVDDFADHPKLNSELGPGRICKGASSASSDHLNSRKNSELR